MSAIYLKLFLLALVSVAFVLLAPVRKGAGQSETYLGKLKIVAKRSPQDFVPDGDLSKKVWKDAEVVRIDQNARGPERFPEFESRVAGLWTDRYVYFAFWNPYRVLNIYEGESPEKERWELWQRDVVEVFINPQPERFNHYYEFEVAPNNQWIDLVIDLTKKPFNDAKWDSGFEHATRIDDKNLVWTCEMRIPVAVMEVQQMKPDTEWRLNFYRADGPGADSQRRFMTWSPLPKRASFHQPASFSIIRFVK